MTRAIAKTPGGVRAARKLPSLSLRETSGAERGAMYHEGKTAVKDTARA